MHKRPAMADQITSRLHVRSIWTGWCRFSLRVRISIVLPFPIFSAHPTTVSISKAICDPLSNHAIRFETAGIIPRPRLLMARWAGTSFISSTGRQMFFVARSAGSVLSRILQLTRPIVPEAAGRAFWRSCSRHLKVWTGVSSMLRSGAEMMHPLRCFANSTSTTRLSISSGYCRILTAPCQLRAGPQFGRS